MTSLETVLQMKAMAVDPRKRGYLLKDMTCVGGLVMVLSNADVNIVTLALETLIILSEKMEYRTTLRNFMGMTDQLQILLNKPSVDEKVKELADKLYITLTQSDRHTPLKDTCNLSVQSSNRSSKKSSTSKNRSLLGGSKSSKHIVLQIRGMVDRSDRELIMKLVLQVRGVISITFDLNRHRCIMRTKQDVKPETLVHTIAKSMTMTAQQVIKDDNGEEVFLSFGSNLQDMDKENTTLPDYLPEEMESPTQDSKSLARVAPEDKKSSGWLSTAASFLTNSFYW